VNPRGPIKVAPARNSSLKPENLQQIDVGSGLFCIGGGYDAARSCEDALDAKKKRPAFSAERFCVAQRLR
jgi:hypothetical protein